MEERLKGFLEEMLEHYCIPGEALEAFPSWWDRLKDCLEDEASEPRKEEVEGGCL